MSYGGFERGGQRRWEPLTELVAHEHISAFEEAHAKGESLYAYCARVGVQRNALAEAIHRLLPNRVEELIGKPGDPQKKGVKFESSLRSMLKTRGYHALRQYGSKSAYDLLCVGRDKPPLMIQAKKDGKLYFNEWNALFDLATEYGCWPVLAMRPPDGTRGALYFKLLARKERKGQRNDGMLLPFDPRDPHQDSLLAPPLAATA